jgi:serine/threonine protein phosphatase PrpC
MICSHGITDTGRVREKNEDRILIDESLGLYIVADGMGGRSHGELAADLAITTMQHYIGSSRGRLDVTWPFGYNFDLSVDANRMTTAIQLANRQVWKRAEQAPEYGGMGTTIAAVLADGTSMTVGNVGDSRVYLWRGSLRQLTVDDTWLKAMSGRGTAEVDMSKYPLRSFLTQAVGSKDLVDVHIVEVELSEDDVVLLSSDGLHGLVPDEEMASTIISGQSISEAGANLVQLASAAGGSDNISVILLKLMLHSKL